MVEWNVAKVVKRVGIRLAGIVRFIRKAIQKCSLGDISQPDYFSEDKRRN